MAVYRIRAHHGMCLAYFKGKGYSGEFTEHMGRIKKELEQDPEVCIVERTDDLCGSCPNNISGVCQSMEKTAGYDRDVLTLCRIEAGETMRWKRFEALVKEKILDADKREDICGDCQWDRLCRKS